MAAHRENRAFHKLTALRGNQPHPTLPLGGSPPGRENTCLLFQHPVCGDW